MKTQIEDSWIKVTEKLVGWFDTLILNVPNMLVAVLLFWCSYWIASHLHSAVDKYLHKIIKQASIRTLIAQFVAFIIISIGIILALSVLNLDGALKSILAGAGVAGLAISLALQGTLSNTFSGIFLAIKKEVNIGDWLETNGYAGKVIDIDLRNTKIKEADNNIVVIPNKIILDNPFKNYGLTKRIRCTITCGVSYNSDLDEVKKVAVSSITQSFPAEPEFPIEFYYTKFGGSSIDFMIRFWVNGQKKLTALNVKSEAIKQMNNAFNRNDIIIPYPIRTLITKDQ